MSKISIFSVIAILAVGSAIYYTVPLAVNLIMTYDWRFSAGTLGAMTIGAVVFFSGIGKEKDSQAENEMTISAALAETQRLAEQGKAIEQFKLGMLYSDGRALPKDQQQAIKCYRLAAEQNEARAQFTLGRIYLLGLEVPKDYILAYMWMSLAISNGLIENDEIQNNSGKDQNPKQIAEKLMDEVSQEMTPEQIAEAEKLAREWKPKSSK